MRKINLSPLFFCLLLVFASFQYASATDPLIPLTDTSCILNLNALTHGEIVNDQYAAVGIHISAMANGGFPDLPIIFNSDLNGTSDPDLELNVGNVLILPTDTVDANNDGFVDDPDDSFNGGVFNFTFDSDYVIYSIVFLDIDNASTPAPFVTALDSAGNALSVSTALFAGNGTIQTVIINTAGVRTLIVNLPQSGAISNLIVGCGSTPLTVAVEDTTLNCYGDNDGVLCASADGGTPPYTYLWDVNAGGQTSACATGLSAGNYTVTVTDGLGLTASFTSSVLQPSQIIVTLDSASIACSTDSSASLTATAVGGTPPFLYAWSANTGGQTTATAVNLGAGTYSITVTDAHGCTAADTSIITVGNPFVASLIGVDASCPGKCDGQLTLSGMGGTPPYTYISNGGFSGSFTTPLSGNKICPGTYSVTVTDQNGCQSSASATIGVPDTVKGDFTITPASCFGSCDGEVTMVISGGSGSWGYKLEDGSTYIYNGPVTASNLCAGTYLVTVSDDNMCFTRTSVTVTQPDPLTVSILGTNNPCFGDCIGTATATPTGGNGGYTYLWSDGQMTATAIGLCAGTYSVTVMDSLGCHGSDSITITEGSELIAIASTASDTICAFGASQLTGSASGGTPAYSYAWSASGGSFDDPLAQNPTYTMGMLGTYQIVLQVTDINGCMDSDTIHINVEGCGSIGDYVWCDDNGDGIQDLTEAPIAGVVIELIQNGVVIATMTTDANGAYDFMNLPPGIYTVNVVDTTVPDGKVITTGNDPLVVNLGPGEDFNDADFGYQYDGSIGDYVWCDDNGDGIQDPTEAPIAGVVIELIQNGVVIATMTTDANGAYDFMNLPPGMYTVNVVDSTVPDGKVITSGNDPLVVNLGPGEDFNDADFGYQYNASIGDYVWCDDNGDGIQDPTEAPIAGVVIELIQNGVVIATMTTDANGAYDFTNLPPGMYTVNVVDSTVPDGKVITTGNDPLVVNLGPGEDFNDADFGYQYNASIGDYVWCDDNGDGIQDLTEAPIAGVVIELIQNGVVIATMTTDANGAYDFTNLPPGMYTVNVVDTTVPAGKVITTNNDSLVVNLGPGEDFNDADFGYQYNGSIGDYVWCDTNSDGIQDVGEPPIVGVVIELIQNGVVIATMTTDTNGAYDFTNLPPGMYTVNVVDASVPAGKVITTNNDSLVVNLGPGEDFNDADFGYNCIPPSLTHIPTAVSCNGGSDGSIDLIVSGGTGTIYTFIWSNDSTTEDIGGLTPGTYSVTVTDENGCSATASETILEPSPITISVTGTNVTCNGFCNGTATVTVGGGNGGFSYLWSDGQTTQTAVGLCAGSYSVTATDAKGCIAVDSLMITEFEPLELVVDSTVRPSCFGLSDGQATVQAQGGIPGYSYLWDDVNAQTTATATGLMAGIYNVSATDSNGCVATINFELDQPKQFSVSVVSNNATCDTVCDAVAVASTLGGVGNMNMYIWDDPFGQTTAIATGFCPGVYQVTATDVTGCTATTSVTIGSNCKTGNAVLNVNNAPELGRVTEESIIVMYPNPASTFSRIDYTSSADEYLNIEMFDITGQMIQSVFSGDVRSGHQISITISTLDISDGVYFVRFTGAESINDIKRLIISK